MVVRKPTLFAMPGTYRVLFVTLALLALSLMLARPLQTQASGGSTWSIVKSPNPSTKPTSNDSLAGVTALSDTDVWAVGTFSTPSNANSTLVEHWNGKAWTVVSSPNGSASGSQLVAVSATAANDIWAVGNNLGASANANTTLIEHWNGKTWTVVSSPDPSNQGDNLTGVVAITPTNAWAVGWFLDNTQSFILPLILHWDGTTWTAVPNLPFNDNTTFLNAISAHSATDIWAVGESGIGPTNVAYHFNGTAWSISPVAIFPSDGQQSLVGVAAIGSKDVWAVGSFAPTTGAEVQTLAIHWNGTTWSQVPTPNVDTFLNRFFGVAAINSKDVWAVGQAVTTDGLGLHTLIEQWNGTQWNIVPSPNNEPQGNNANSLLGVTASGPASLWSIGSFDSLKQGNPGTRTLTAHTTQG